MRYRVMVSSKEEFIEADGFSLTQDQTVIFFKKTDNDVQPSYYRRNVTSISEVDETPKE